MHVIKFFTTTVILSLIFSACKTSKSSSSSNGKSKIENFDLFYEKFHKDPVFQKSRTKFPLEGKSIVDGKEVKWTPENLPLMKVKIYDIDKKNYKSSFKKGDKSFFQKVWDSNTGFQFEARFDLIANKWYLVYVLDQNF